jgi:two-component system C4-dicarboxylate transport response regulator DctD
MTDDVVLLVEDDPDLRLGCEQAFELAGVAAVAVVSAEAARSYLDTHPVDVVVTDMRLPGEDGMSLLHWLRSVDESLPVIMITGHGGVSHAVEAMRAGAYDFITKPFPSAHLLDVVRRALEKRRLSREVAQLRDLLAQRAGAGQYLIGESPAMLRLRELVTSLAAKNVDVLVHGETGTGKELVARCLHEFGPRAKGHFVAINCGGLPEHLLDSELFGHEAGAFTGALRRRVGKIEHASGGTLFLDEIESMPIAAQIKLLRVLQERSLERLGGNQLVAVDTRIVAATKDDLRQRADEGSFREDLYYRLAVVMIELPPLRERREDIPLLFQHFLQQAAQRHDLPLPECPPELMQRLIAHPWRGNVRELRNMADCFVLGIHRDVLAEAADADVRPPSLAEAVEAFERSLIAAALARCEGNLTRTAASLRVAKTTLFDKLRRHGLEGEARGR